MKFHVFYTDNMPHDQWGYKMINDQKSVFDHFGLEIEYIVKPYVNFTQAGDDHGKLNGFKPLGTFPDATVSICKESFSRWSLDLANANSLLFNFAPAACTLDAMLFEILRFQNSKR